MGSMKVHQFTRGLIWDHHIHLPQHQPPQQNEHQQQIEPCLSLGGCKRLRPLAPKLTTTTTTTISSNLDLKSFIRPESGPRKPSPSSFNDHPKNDSPPQALETHPGGTRWNPTQEQIGILERLYKGGMRTPNAQEIEQITAQLSRYGKIEGKNVFYWFQNHKARERQKQKRNSLGLSPSPRALLPSAVANSLPLTNIIAIETTGEMLFAGGELDNPCKRKCRSWAFECLQGGEEIKTCREEGDRTLELFPLHPEGKLIGSDLKINNN